MASKLYVGNMSYATTEDELREAFAPYGEVLRVDILYDRDTGRPRGFGFVEMASPEQADAAIAGLNGKDLGGRSLRVDVARERRRSY